VRRGLGQEDKWVQKEWTLAERFAANVVWFRHEAGLSQQELAERIGMSRTVLGVLEQGRRLPRLDTILKLAAGLEVGTCELLAWLWWLPARHEHHETPPEWAASEGFDVLDFDLPGRLVASAVGYESDERFIDRLRQRKEKDRARAEALGEEASQPLPLEPPEESWVRAAGEAVRELREERGLTRQELAERVATTAGFLEEVEEGRCPHPAPSFMERLHRGFGMDREELFAQIELRVLGDEG
jgi:transcriptional regulator with XRE-family HTH domain